MQIWVEHLSLRARIKSLQPMLLQRLHQNGICHLQTLIKTRQFFVAVCLSDLVCRNGVKGAVEVVDAFDEV